MPFEVLDILAQHDNDRAKAIAYCLSAATNYPLQREMFEKYAFTLGILKGGKR
jgi:hypothetical protein